MAHEVTAGGELDYTVGSDNVFEDLGFDHPEEELARAKLVMAIGQAVRERNLTQARAAALLGIDQPKVSALLRGRYGGFSTDRLLRLVVNADSVPRDARLRPVVASAYLNVLAYRVRHRRVSPDPMQPRDGGNATRIPAPTTAPTAPARRG